ncbi:MAG: hypothetical protein AMJ81_06155 [Phycisphaerae bacterium SM23_33]|nr:MAG: hypothetical protein AMJ81_06155 [Phycisphaerae bacterium SM23_33]
MKSFLTSCKESSAGDEIILDMIKLTEGMEDRILDKGVGLYYDLHPCGVQMAGRDVTAVLFACTPGASLAALAGAGTRRRESATKGTVVRYSMLCANPPKQPALTVKTVPQLAGGRVVMHGDFAEFRLRLAEGGSAFDGSVRDLAARRLAATAAIELKQSGALGSGAFARGGDVLLADPTRRIVSRSAGGKLTLDACRPKEIDNLLVCSPTVDVDDAVAAALVEPLGGASLADVIARAPWSELSRKQSVQAPTVRLSCAPLGSGKALKGQARFTELSPIYRTSGAISIGGIQLDVIADCDVLVVGAGTSGMPAAVVAAQRGADTIAVEKYGDVGGTHTIGGVSKYWYGRRTEFVNRIDKDAKAMMTRSAMPKCMGMLSVLMRARPRLVTHCLAVGAVVDGPTISGAVVVTPRGLGIIRAKRVIDATGDGDIAARAGAETEYGTRRDAMTLWYSFAQYSGTNPEAARHFAYVVDPRDPTDMTRAIIAGRRYKRRKVSFPQVYLTPRESRHIRGAYRVTVADLLAERRFEDLLLICRANFDIKGMGDSDLTFSGYVEWSRLKEYSVQIPYRAIRPVDLENILVVGKAYSVSHDVLALARMQRDLMAMGGAAGLIAADSARAGTSLARLDAKALQVKLVKLGVLSQDDLQSIKGVRDNALPPMSKDELRRLIGQLAAGELKLDGQVNILARPKAAIPLLKEALAQADGKAKAELARALCFLGDPNGSPALLEELRRLLSDKTLPGISRGRVTPHHLPDQGFAPDATYLINTLARLGDRSIIPFLADIAKKVEPETHKTGTMFSYIFSVCYAAERLGAPGCIEALTILADKQGIRGGSIPRGTDPRRTARGLVSMRDDRYAYLELCLGRALARCGSRRGYRIMLEYLQDIRGSLARSAHDELVALTGLDLGYDANAWRASLRSAKVVPKPYRHDAPAARRQRVG